MIAFRGFNPLVGGVPTYAFALDRCACSPADAGACGGLCPYHDACSAGFYGSDFFKEKEEEDAQEEAEQEIKQEEEQQKEEAATGSDAHGWLESHQRVFRNPDAGIPHFPRENAGCFFARTSGQPWR